MKLARGGLAMPKGAGSPLAQDPHPAQVTRGLKQGAGQAGSLASLNGGQLEFRGRQGLGNKPLLGEVPCNWGAICGEGAKIPGPATHTRVRAWTPPAAAPELETCLGCERVS